MRLLDACREYLDSAIASAGSGIKTMLLDSESFSAVSVAYPQSRLMARGVYHFERIESQRSKEVRRISTLQVQCAPDNRFFGWTI